MSPPVWDFAHIGYFEELWLLRELGGEPPARAEHDDVYDAFAHERSERGELPILQPSAAREYVADVRGRVLVLLPTVSLGGTDPLLENGFLFGMIVQHELQHIETMTQTLQLGSLPGPEQSAPPAGDDERRRARRGEVVLARRRRGAPGPTTTNGRATTWSCRRSGSTEGR